MRLIVRLYHKLQAYPELQMNMDAICEQFGVSRQAHYQMVQRRLARQEDEAGVLELVRQVRRKHPRMGGRKLLFKIRPMLRQEGVNMGRDRLFDLLRDEDLLVKRKKHQRRTTIAGLLRTPNLLTGLCIDHPNQVWVCDITYVEVEVDQFAYLFLLMDLYSRFLLGWHVSPSLVADGALLCLDMSLKYLPVAGVAPIHHSDHGVQYTSQVYREALRQRGLLASMGEVGNCYDNIYAERVIGTMKNEYQLGDRFVDQLQVSNFVPEIAYLYNFDRPHLSLGMLTPAQVYFGQAGLIQPLIIPAAGGTL